MATQCSGDVHLSIKWPERVYTDLPINFSLNLLPVFTELVNVFLLNPFPTCFRYQIHSGIEHGHDLGTTKNRWITNQEILGLSTFIHFY